MTQKQVNVYYRYYPSSELLLVARVSVPDSRNPLEHAFRVTQNIGGSWSRGPSFVDGTVNPDYSEDITVLAPNPVLKGVEYGHRSSMVGDIFEMDGHRWEVVSVGFREVKP